MAQNKFDGAEIERRLRVIEPGERVPLFNGHYAYVYSELLARAYSTARQMETQGRVKLTRRKVWYELKDCPPCSYFEYAAIGQTPANSITAN
jgi:hypothetical protein